MSGVNQLPRITVIVPSYQQGRYLDAALRSVIEQRYPGLELLVYDGGSSDQSVEVIGRHERDITWWQSRPDGGQVAAINAGLQRATGQVVGWLNSDDVLLPGALHAIGRAFTDKRVQMVSGWNVSFDDAGQVKARMVYPPPNARVMRGRFFLPQETVYWRRELIGRVGMLNDHYKLIFDYEYWLRLLEAGAEVHLIRRYIGGFRRHAAQKTQVHQQLLDAEVTELLVRYHGPGSDLTAIKRSKGRWWRRRRTMYEWLAAYGWFRCPALPEYVRCG